MIQDYAQVPEQHLNDAQTLPVIKYWKDMPIFILND
jgi:hypothetical protein